MNRAYRLVWNRALRVLQVASELTRASPGGSNGEDACFAPQRRTLATACALALGIVLATPAFAEQVASGGNASEASMWPYGIPNPDGHLTITYDGLTNTLTVDPQDLTVAASGGDITGTALSTNLGTGNVTLLSSGGAAAGAGDINVNDAVSWSANTLTLTAANNININSTLAGSGSGALVLNPSTSNGADVGVAGGAINVNSGGGTVSTGGSQAWNGVVALNTDTTLTSTGGGAIDFASTVDGAHALTVNTTGVTTFGGAVGGTTALTSLTTGAGGGTALNGNINTTGAQTYNDAVTLGADVTATSSGSGAITFNSTMDGAHALSVNTSGSTTFGGAVGGTTALTSLTTNAGGSTTLDGNVNTTGAQIYNDAVSLGADVTAASSGSGAIAFNSTVDGAHNLTINTGGQTTFGGAVGGTTALSSLTTDGAGGTTLGGNVSTTGAQTYNDSVTLGADITAASSGAIAFNSTVDGAHNLTINTGGQTTFAGAVGGTTALTSLTTDAGGSTVLDGNINTTGAQTYNDAVVLAGDVVARSSSGNIEFASSVDGAHTLTVDTGGAATFGSTVGGTAALAGLIANSGTFSANALRINGNLAVKATGGAIVQGGSWTVVGTSGFDAGSNSITLTNAGNDFQGAVSATGTGISISDANDLDIASLSDNTNGSVSLIAGGNLNLPVGSISTGTGDLMLAANGGTLSTSGDLSGNNVSLTGRTGLNLANNITATGTLGLNTTNAAIAQLAGSLQVGGTTSVNAGTGAIVLTSAGNDFIGAVALTGGNAQIVDANALMLGPMSTGALTANSTGALGLGSGTVNGNLSATSNGGAIGQSGALNVGGTSDINAGTGAITLTNAGNNFQGAVSATGSGISLADAGDLTIASLIDGGNGSVSLVAGGTLVLPTTTINTGTGDLTLAANGGTLTTSGDLSGNNISMTGRDGMTLAGNVNAAGNVTLDSGGTMLLTGNLAAGGNTSIDSGTLQVGNGTVGGSISGDVVDKGTLTFDLGSATLDGATFLGYGDTISGSGSLRAINTSSVTSFGFLTLSGQNTFSGGTEVGGTAAGETNDINVIADNVNALGTGAVTVNQPGDLRITGSGSGDVFSNTLTNAGYTQFNDLTLGGQTVTNGGTFGVMDFSTGASAGSATLVNTSILSFEQDSSAGNATIRNSGSVNFSDTSSADNAVIQNSGEVGIGNAGDLSIGSLSGTGSVQLGAGTLILGGLGFDDTISGNIIDGFLVSGGSLAKTGTGTLTLDGQDTYTGGTEVRQGTLIVGSVAGNGASLAGNVDVDNGATLGGHGTIGGSVDVAGGGHVAPGDSIGTLTVAGNFTAAQGSVLDFEFGAPGPDSSTFGTGDSVSVGGNLELDGATLNVTDAGGFGPGLYNLFSYGGTLTQTNGSLSFGATPSGTVLQFQYLTADKQINLLNTTGYTLNFWNGNGLASSTQMGGGNGTWSTTAQEWTDASGSVTAAMQPQPGFAIFGGAAGTVTVDNSGGDVSATGMQFASDGYVLTGDTLTLVGSSGNAPIIRVGDGSSAGAAMSATINNVIAGSDGLVKSDLGTLVLAGANTFSGGLTINGGTLAVAKDGNLGVAANTITLDDGALETTAAFTTARDFALQGNGTLQTDADLTITSAVSGGGGLIKDGAGTLVLAGTNTFSGGTTISAGTLQIGDGGTTGSIVGNVTDNAALVFDRDDALTFAGAISGTGSLTQNGAGTLTLNGANPLTGITRVQTGKLVVGDDSHPDASLGGTVSVDSGAALGGIGTIGGLDLSGTLASGNSIGTLHVAGDAIFEQGSVFQVEANSAGAADQLAATGTVSIKGGDTLVIAQGSNWAPRSDYTLITAGAGVSGQFASVSDNLTFLDPVLTYQSNAVELSLQRNDSNFNTVAVTPNEYGVATGANGLGFDSPLYNVLVFLDPATARGAFDQLSGELHASQQTARVDDSRFVREAMDQRLQQGGTGALDAWAHAWGHWGSVDGDGNAAKLSNNGDGLLVGADLPVGAQGRVGLTGGSARNSLSIQDRNSWGRTTSTWLGVYGGLGNGPFALRAGVAYAWDRIPVNRQVEFPGVSERLSSNATGNTLTGFVEGAWKIQTAAGEYEPYLDFAHVRLNTDATTETGGDAALHVSSESENVSFSTLGARGSWQLGGTQLHGGIGWQHAFGDTTPQRTLQFLAGGDAFTVFGVPVAQNAALVNVGADWKLSPNVKLDASYNGQWASSARDQAAKLSLSVAF